MQGTALLVTGVESEGRLKIAIFRDKCSPSLKSVYYKADGLREIVASLSAFPGRRFDDVKVGIIDANIRSLSASSVEASEPIILIDRVYSVRKYDDPTFVGS